VLPARHQRAKSIEIFRPNRLRRHDAVGARRQDRTQSQDNRRLPLKGCGIDFYAAYYGARDFNPVKISRQGLNELVSQED
jgi:hypothetical protein